MGFLAAEEEPSHGREVEARPNRLWMLSFESSDVAQLGGLGSAVASLAKALAEDNEVCVFMPSHGRHIDVRLRKKLGLNAVHGFVCDGERRGVDGSVYPYVIGMEEGHFEGVRYFLVKGLEQGTSQWLDDERIYDGEATYQKMSLFARGMKGYLRFILAEHPERRPDVVHANDWHSIPAAVALKQVFVEESINFFVVLNRALDIVLCPFDWEFLNRRIKDLLLDFRMHLQFVPDFLEQHRLLLRIFTRPLELRE